MSQMAEADTTSVDATTAQTVPSPGRQVGVLLFPEVELLDYCGPLEVFTVAARLLERPIPSLHVFTIAEREGPLKTRAGSRVLPDYTLESHPRIDILVVPGGWGTRREVDNAQLISWIGGVMATAQITASVCTGVFLLARTGRLGRREVTTHWASLDRLATDFPELIVASGVRWVDTGDVVTSAGISAGIDMSLHLVARLFGDDLARRTARQMEYEWVDAATGAVK
jgi:transcriptional regulator GlxA family with amidase domain